MNNNKKYKVEVIVWEVNEFDNFGDPIDQDIVYEEINTQTNNFDFAIKRANKLLRTI